MKNGNEKSRPFPGYKRPVPCDMKRSLIAVIRQAVSLDLLSHEDILKIRKIVWLAALRFREEIEP